MVGGVGSNEPELVDGGIGMAGATGIAIGGCRAAISSVFDGRDPEQSEITSTYPEVAR